MKVLKYFFLLVLPAVIFFSCTITDVEEETPTPSPTATVMLDDLKLTEKNLYAKKRRWKRTSGSKWYILSFNDKGELAVTHGSDSKTTVFKYYSYLLEKDILTLDYEKTITFNGKKSVESVEKEPKTLSYIVKLKDKILALSSTDEKDEYYGNYNQIR